MFINCTFVPRCRTNCTRNMLSSIVKSTAVRTLAAASSRAAIPSMAHVSRRGYHENIVEHYENPRNVGSLDKNDLNVGTVSVLTVW